MAAVYEILIKLAEAYDERQDYHDTSGWLLRDYAGHTRNVSAIVNVSSKSFLSGSGDKTLKLWHSKKDDPIQTFKGHTHRVSSVDAFNETQVLSGSWDESAKLWDISTGKCVLSFVGHEDAVTTVIASTLSTPATTTMHGQHQRLLLVRLRQRLRRRLRRRRW